MVDYILSDLNVRDEFVTTSTDVMIYDTKVVVQSVWRLLTTNIGEIPNFRNYGLDVKRFLQYPLSEETVEAIYEHVKSRLSAFEDRAEIMRAEVNVNFQSGQINMLFYLRVRTTGEIVALPTWTVQVAA